MSVIEMNAPVVQRDEAAVPASLRFIAQDSPQPRVYIEAEQSRYEGKYAYHDVAIRNAWPHASRFNLDQNGFELAGHRSQVADFEDTTEVESTYYSEIEDLVKAKTGATRVLIFDATVRKSGNTNGRQPARHVHNDYTEISAPQRVRDFLGEEEAESLLQGDYAQINVWRSIAGTVERTPLAFLDAATLKPDDLARTEIHNDGRIGEIYGVHHTADQRWYYFPKMSDDVAILIKGFDSRAHRHGGAVFTPHTAFDDPTTAPDAPARQSIEVRTFAFFD